VTSSGAQELSRNNAQKCLKVGGSASSILVCTPLLSRSGGGGGGGGDASGSAAAARAARRAQHIVFLGGCITFCRTTHHPPRLGTAAAGARPRAGASHCAGARHAATATASTVCCRSISTEAEIAAGGRAECSLPPAQSRVPALHRQPTDFGAQFPSSLRCCSTLHSSKHQLSLARSLLSHSRSVELQFSTLPSYNVVPACLPARSLSLHPSFSF
jgi:hypothetical protein